MRWQKYVTSKKITNLNQLWERYGEDFEVQYKGSIIWSAM